MSILSLPKEILFEISSFLNAKSIFEFFCSEKNLWNTLLSTPNTDIKRKIILETYSHSHFISYKNVNKICLLSYICANKDRNNKMKNINLLKKILNDDENKYLFDTNDLSNENKNKLDAELQEYITQWIYKFPKVDEWKNNFVRKSIVKKKEITFLNPLTRYRNSLLGFILKTFREENLEEIILSKNYLRSFKSLNGMLFTNSCLSGNEKIIELFLQEYDESHKNNSKNNFISNTIKNIFKNKKNNFETFSEVAKKKIIIRGKFTINDIPLKYINKNIISYYLERSVISNEEYFKLAVFMIASDKNYFLEKITSFPSFNFSNYLQKNNRSILTQNIDEFQKYKFEVNFNLSKDIIYALLKKFHIIQVINLCFFSLNKSESVTVFCNLFFRKRNKKLMRFFFGYFCLRCINENNEKEIQHFFNKFSSDEEDKKKLFLASCLSNVQEIKKIFSAENFAILLDLVLSSKNNSKLIEYVKKKYFALVMEIKIIKRNESLKCFNNNDLLETFLSNNPKDKDLFIDFILYDNGKYEFFAKVLKKNYQILVRKIFTPPKEINIDNLFDKILLDEFLLKNNDVIIPFLSEKKLVNLFYELIRNIFFGEKTQYENKFKMKNVIKSIFYFYPREAEKIFKIILQSSPENLVKNKNDILRMIKLSSSPEKYFLKLLHLNKNIFSDVSIEKIHTFFNDESYLIFANFRLDIFLFDCKKMDFPVLSTKDIPDFLRLFSSFIHSKQIENNKRKIIIKFFNICLKERKIIIENSYYKKIMKIICDSKIFSDYSSTEKPDYECTNFIFFLLSIHNYSLCKKILENDNENKYDYRAIWDNFSKVYDNLNHKYVKQKKKSIDDLMLTLVKIPSVIKILEEKNKGMSSLLSLIK